MNQHGGLVTGPGQGISVPRGQRHNQQQNLHGQGAMNVQQNAQLVNLSNHMNHGGQGSSQAISSGSGGVGGNPGAGGGHQNHRNHHQNIHGHNVQGGHGNSQQAQMNLGPQPGTVVSNAGGGQGVPQHGGPPANFNPWAAMVANPGNHNAYGIQTSNPYGGGHPGTQPGGHLLHPGSGPGTPATTFIAQGPGQPVGGGPNQHPTIRVDAAAIQSINVSVQN